MTQARKVVREFGPFTLDPVNRLLTRNGVRVPLPDAQLDMLVATLSSDGKAPTEEEMRKAVWGDAPVSADTFGRTLGDLVNTMIDEQLKAFSKSLEETRTRKDFSATSGLPIDVEKLAPHRSFIDGTAPFISHPSDAIDRAWKACARARQDAPHAVEPCLGMANACLMRYEATRGDLEPDRGALLIADHQALEATQADPYSADAHATLAMVWRHIEPWGNAMTVALKATLLEPNEWRHQVRLAIVGWGNRRLQALRRAETLSPRLAIVPGLVAPVHIARAEWEAAVDRSRQAARLQDAGGAWGPPPGQHLLHGLVLAARGAMESALEEWEQELACEDRGHVHGREVLADTWYAMGAVSRRLGRLDEAEAGFVEALALMPGHGLAAVGLGALSGRAPRPGVHTGSAMDRAMIQAAILTVQGRHAQAAKVCAEAIRQEQRPSAGWKLAVDPLLDVTAHTDVWAEPLRLVRKAAFI